MRPVNGPLGDLK